MSDVTRILAQIETGDSVAMNELLPLVYDELRQMAAAQMLREKPGQTLQATALVHEVYVKLFGTEADCTFANRRHSFGAAADAMRRILIDSARRKKREKRGGQLRRIELDDEFMVQPQESEQLLALNEALIRFAEYAPEKNRIGQAESFRWPNPGRCSRYARDICQYGRSLVEVRPCMAESRSGNRSRKFI